MLRLNVYQILDAPRARHGSGQQEITCMQVHHTLQSDRHIRRQVIAAVDVDRRVAASTVPAHLISL